MTKVMKKGLTTRSVRVNLEHWNEGRRKAAAEGLTMSALLSDLLQGYLEGHYILPKREYKVIRQYVQK